MNYMGYEVRAKRGHEFGEGFPYGHELEGQAVDCLAQVHLVVLHVQGRGPRQTWGLLPEGLEFQRAPHTFQALQTKTNPEKHQLNKCKKQGLSAFSGA